MVLNYTTYRLECIHPFKISRSSYDYYDRLFIYIEQDGLIGRGEAAPSERYGESIQQILDLLKHGFDLPKNVDDISELIDTISNRTKGINSLRSACINALIDWFTQKNNLSVTDYYQIPTKIQKPTSFTIGLSNLSKIENKIKEAEDYKILKVKLGTREDKTIIKKIRKYTDKPIRVDANEGWDIDTAKSMCEWLSKKRIELVEQPLSVSNLNQMEELKNVSPLPLFADENCINSSDISKLTGKFDGINIKLSKCGGLDEAMLMVKIAKENDLKIMLGCMVESSIGITAIAQLAALADYLDIDGNLLVNNDPYLGLKIIDGMPILSNKSGLGLELKDKYIINNMELR